MDHTPNKRQKAYLSDGIIKAKIINVISAVLTYKLENVYFIKYNRI